MSAHQRGAWRARRRKPQARPQVAHGLLLLVFLPLLVQAGQPHFQLAGQAGGQARLPCLVGRASVCGQPYFIAWYKQDAREGTWTRFEYREPGEAAGQPGPGRPLSERAEFRRPASDSSQLCQELGPSAAHFGCGQLLLRQLELLDEGQYKCEVTFSESLEVDKCPPYTVSQLSVTARPSEPQLLVNGHRWEPDRQPPPAIKEGAQVRLECQSSGGKPAPQIEWLNLTEPSEAAGEPRVELMRLSWPLKRTSWAAGEPPRNLSQPLAASLVTFSLSRHDLRSQFVCVVGSQPPGDLLRRPGYLAALLRQGQTPMLRQIKLDVQGAVKPSRVSLQVRDLETNLSLELRPATPQAPAAHYSLRPNRLYALQCVVEEARPAAQVSWYNRTQRIELRPQRLASADFELPSSGERHRLSSFSRLRPGAANGTFSTTASLLLTSSVWDNYEELFCQISSEAFSFDELAQVAPIVSARLFVNFAPFAWLEPLEPQAAASRQGDKLRVGRGQRMALQCTLAANPMGQSAIVQLEWLRDGRPLEAADQQQAERIERANQLHLPTAANSKLLASSQLSVANMGAEQAATYACHFRLVFTSAGARSLAGQAERALQVELLEAEPRRPTIRVQPIEGPLLLFGRPPRPLTALLAGPQQQLSLRCQLDGQSLEPASRHKVVWYLDGRHLHSSASSDLYKLAPGELQQLGALTCAHQLLPADNFHAADIRVYPSANQLQLSYKAKGSLLARRPDLMPAVRSFSEPELAAAPNGRLKLACLAQCEPLCSIQWLLDGRPLSANQQQQQQQQLEPNGSWPLEPAGLARLAGLEARGPAPNGSRFSWLKATALAWPPTAMGEPEQLLGQAEPLLAAAGANVLAKLELGHHQLGQLLAERDSPLEIKCKLSRRLDGQLGWALIDPQRWFPDPNLPLSFEPLDLDHEAAIWRDPSHLNEQQLQPDNADEMQINILLDKPPRGASLWLLAEPSRPISELSLTDADLLAELLQPTKLAGQLECRPLGNPYPPVQYRWSFTDLNNTQHLISASDPTQPHRLQLAHFIQLRQRQLGLQPAEPHAAQLVASLVGNYTCHVSNLHGSSSSSLSLKVQGRPLCKLSLAGEYLSADNELLAKLRCSIYSAPALQETFWFKSNKQIAVNRTTDGEPPVLADLELPVLVLNKQQDFMLADLISSESNGVAGNFKCFARNPLGFSKPCELDVADRQTLLSSLKPTGTRSPAFSLFSDPKLPVHHLMSANSSSSVVELTTSISQPVSSLMRNLIGRLDLILMALGSLTLACLLFIASASILRRRRGDHHRKLRASQYDTSWRFNTALRSSNSNQEISPSAFQASKKVCVNYYGGSGDSEHDMIQSSHSSHYDDYQHQHQQQQQQQQQYLQQPISLNQHPIYFNHSTLNRRPLKSSMSSSSTGESIACKSNRLAKNHFNTMRLDLNAASTKPLGLDATMGSLTTNNNNNRPLSGLLNADGPAQSEPLVDGTHHTSRINLDANTHHRNGHYASRQYSRDQQTFAATRNEHIYDDVIYQQMIL